MTASPDRAVAAAIRRAGQDPDSAHGRDRATARHCPRCSAPTLVGLDAEVAAMSVTVDPWPLTIRDEATALLTGRPTYRVTESGGRLRIRHRDHWQILGTPPTTVHVVAAHRCGQPLGDTSSSNPTTTNEGRSCTCPF